MLALLLLAVTATLLVVVGMPMLLWSLSMETLSERALAVAAPRSSSHLKLVHSSRGSALDTADRAA